MYFILLSITKQRYRLTRTKVGFLSNELYPFVFTLSESILSSHVVLDILFILLTLSVYTITVHKTTFLTVYTRLFRSGDNLK